MCNIFSKLTREKSSGKVQGTFNTAAKVVARTEVGNITNKEKSSTRNQVITDTCSRKNNILISLQGKYKIEEERKMPRKQKKYRKTDRLSRDF